MGKLYGEIQEELSAFKDFKNNFKFRQLALEAKGLEIYCVDLLVKDKDDNTTAITDKWINVGYKLNNPFSRCLSNLFPYEFIFKGKKARSIEAVLQCLKFKDIDKQDILLTYSGIDAKNAGCLSEYDWKETGLLFWQGKEIVRNSNDYDNFLDELYIGAIQNPPYRNAIIACPEIYILHSIGAENKKETVLTRYEFEARMNCLKAFLKER